MELPRVMTPPVTHTNTTGLEATSVGHIPSQKAQPASPVPKFTPSSITTAPAAASSPKALFPSSPLSFRSANAFGTGFTPPRFFAPQLTSPVSFPLLPNSALPLQPAEDSAGIPSFGTASAIGSGSPGNVFGSPRLHTPSPSPFDADGNTSSMLQPPKRKRHMSDSSATPRELLFSSLKRDGGGGASSTFDRDLASSGSDVEEYENSGKKLKVRGIMNPKARRASQPLQLPESSTGLLHQSTFSGASNNVGLIGVMDRLSIESETMDDENDRGRRTSISSPYKKEKSRLKFGGATLIEDEGDHHNSESTAMDETNCEEEDETRNTRQIRPLPTRRRLRSPPPVVMADGEDTEEDEDDTNNPEIEATIPPQSGDSLTQSPIPSSSSSTDTLPVTFTHGLYSGSTDSPDIDDEEDLTKGAKGAFYYKPTAAERWARSQKRLQQIREYKDRESREARERRRRRRAASVGSGSSPGSMRRKVHFAA